MDTRHYELLRDQAKEAAEFFAKNQENLKKVEVEINKIDTSGFVKQGQKSAITNKQMEPPPEQIRYGQLNQEYSELMGANINILQLISTLSDTILRYEQNIEIRKLREVLLRRKS